VGDAGTIGTAASTCSGWTSAAGSASATNGWPSTTMQSIVGFAAGGGYNCGSSTRVFCLEQ
jgi:hypothetical protein